MPAAANEPIRHARVFDPEVDALLEIIRKAGRPPFEALTPAEARAAYAASWDLMQSPAEAVGSVRDVLISRDTDAPAAAMRAAPPGEVGPEQGAASATVGLRLRVYRPLGSSAAAPLAGICFLHGGGWVIGNLESHDRLCRRLCNLAQACVVAIDYRLAPEHPFPAALDDAALGLRAIVTHAEALAIDPARIGLVGDSAGGNLAAVLALMSRDATLPPTRLQVLIYPVTDLAAESGSYASVTEGVPLTAATMRWFIDHYTPRAADRADWRASPIRAPSLAGTPPALVVTTAADPLCDEGRAYAKRLEAEGVRVSSLHLGGQLHGMAMQGRWIGASNIVVDYIGAAIGHELNRLATGNRS
ncbi:MAG: alpha/beta hydrolase [Lautropia sp.]